MSLESEWEGAMSYRGPGLVWEPQHSAAMPLLRGSPYHHLSIKNLLSLQRGSDSANMDSLTN